MPPNELESYAIAIVRAMLAVKDLPADATEAQRARAYRAQADLLKTLVDFLLDHYTLAGYNGAILARVLMNQTSRWARAHTHTPPD